MRNNGIDNLYKEGDAVYDDFYADIYDYLVYSGIKNDYEVGTIINNSNPSETSVIADIGCGTGHHVANLTAKKGKTVEVYRLVYTSEKVAVFGVGLQSTEDGEAHFLPKIGEAHVAALPYEIILQGTKATMLHGKYRIALHWPELTMGTFMKIMSTPGDIEDTLEELCK